MSLNRDYLDAVMSGNKDEAERLKKELNDRFESRQIRRRTSPIKVNTILNDDSSKSIDIYNFLNEKFKDNWWDWEIETLERMLWINYATILSDINVDKIQALKLLLNSQMAYSDWYDFNQVAVALGGAIADFTMVKSPSPGMAVSAMNLMHHMRPDEEFGRDVKKYVCLLLINDGIYTPPPSIAKIIKEEFKALVSPESRAEWSDTFKKFLSGGSIQADRLLFVEKAAEKY